MTNQLQVYKGMTFGELTAQDITTIRETIGKDCNESQFKLFMGVAKSSGANPLTNEIYAAVRGGQLTIQYGYDLYVRKAKEADGFRGYDVQLVHENDKVSISRKTNEDGESFMVVTDHDISFPRGKAIACYAVAFREGVIPFSVFMETSAVEHLKKSNIGMQKTMWTNYFDDMFKKHALKRALKGQFGLEFDDQPAGPTADDIPEYRPAPKDITPKPTEIEQQSEEVEQKNHLRDEINAKFKQLGINSNKDAADWLSLHAPKINPKTASEPEMVGLIQLLDMNIEMLEVQQQGDDDLL